MTESSDQPGADQEPAPEAPKRATRPRRRRTTAKAASEAASSAEPEAPKTEAAQPEPPPPVQPSPTTDAPAMVVATPPAGRGRTRSIASWILTVLAGIAVAASVVGYWAHETLLDTDKFMAAVTPAVQSDAVKQVVADRLADQVLEALDLDTRVADALDAAADRMSDAIASALDLSPTQAARLQRLNGGLQLLAGSIAGGLETRIREAIDTFVTSREGDGLLVGLVTKLHERTVLLLRDELDQLPSIDVESGEVKLNLVPMVAESIRRVVNAGIVAIGGERQIPPFDSSEDAEQAIDRLAGIVGHDLPPDFGQVALMNEDQLRNAQDAVKTFDRLVWILIALSILLAIGAFLLAPSWTAGLLRVGVAVAVAVFVGWFAVGAIADAVAQAAQTPEGQTAVADIAGAVIHSLQPLATVLILVGLVVALAAFVFDRRAVEVAA
jgi:hypothetical protein